MYSFGSIMGAMTTKISLIVQFQSKEQIPAELSKDGKTNTLSSTTNHASSVSNCSIRLSIFLDVTTIVSSGLTASSSFRYFSTSSSGWCMMFATTTRLRRTHASRGFCFVANANNLLYHTPPEGHCNTFPPARDQGHDCPNEASSSGSSSSTSDSRSTCP